MKKHSKALVFFTVSKQIPVVYSADRGRAEKNIVTVFMAFSCLVNTHTFTQIRRRNTRHLIRVYAVCLMEINSF